MVQLAGSRGSICKKYDAFSGRCLPKPVGYRLLRPLWQLRFFVVSPARCIDESRFQECSFLTAKLEA